MPQEPYRRVVVTSEDQWAEVFVDADPRRENIQLSLWGMFEATITVQVRRTESDPWRDIKQYTTPIEKHAIFKAPLWVRVGVKAGDFTSGSLVIELAQNFTPAQGDPFGEDTGTQQVEVINDVGSPIPVAIIGDINTLDSGEHEFTHVGQLVTAMGDTVLYTPPAGMRIRLRWSYAIPTASSLNFPVITVSLGGEVKFVVSGLSKRQRVTGPVDGSLVVNLSAPATVPCTFLLEEVA